jgi:NTE family protein
MDGLPVAEIGVGEPIGELAFLTGEPRTATVVAARDSDVLEISRDCYDLLVARAPRFQQALLQRLADRMRRAAPAARPLSRTPARTIALCPIGDAPVPERLTRRLAEALAALGRTEVVEAGDIPRGEDGAALLAKLEQACRFVLLPLAGGANAANERLLHHSDAVMLVGRLADEPADRGGRLERAALDLFLPRNRTLLLWRERSSEPIAGSAAWLKDRPVDLHHHVALDAPADIARVARFLAGEALGAVLGGGGALGCGHIGMVRAFRDAGVGFDMFGGASAGAAIGLAFATAASPEELMDRTEEIFVKKRAMRRYTLPVFSLLDHTVFDRELAAHYGDLDIRDLPVNAYAVSTNLTRNAMQVHRAGPVWQAVRSSGSIPGALPPFVTEEGEMLVDGALLDNFPISTMRELKLGPNVLAGFFEDQTRRHRLDYAAVPGRGRLFADLLLRRPRKFPHLLTVLTRAMLVTSRRCLQETAIGADLMIKLPSPRGMGVLDWHRGRAQEEAAYRFVTALIEEAGGAAKLIEGVSAARADR